MSLGILTEVKEATPILSYDELARLLGPGDWRLTKVHRDGSLTYTKKEIVELYKQERENEHGPK